MSNAKPMTWDRRMAGYVNQRKPGYTGDRHVLTARQLRRLWHKELHASHGDYEGFDVDGPRSEQPKGAPTPRRLVAIAVRLGWRRSEEQRKDAERAAAQAATELEAAEAADLG